MEKMEQGDKGLSTLIKSPLNHGDDKRESE